MKVFIVFFLIGIMVISLGCINKTNGDSDSEIQEGDNDKIQEIETPSKESGGKVPEKNEGTVEVLG